MVRPILQTTFALNYAITGYQMWSWHLVQILVHTICVLGLKKRLNQNPHTKPACRFGDGSL